MSDIAYHLTKADKQLRAASEAICNGTLSPSDRAALREALNACINHLEDGLTWLDGKPAGMVTLMALHEQTMKVLTERWGKVL